jgi:excisionase family DNA binding protein
MPHRILSLQQAAQHIKVTERELFHLVQRNEIPFIQHGDEVRFEHCQLDDWAQCHIMELSKKSLAASHREAIADRTKHAAEDALVERLFRPAWIEPALASKTKPGVLRDMVKLAVTTELLYDDAAFLRELEARESVSSTAVGGGVAFLHARYHDPYISSDSFVVLGKTLRPIFFGAPDGEETDLFFLICCTDDRLHLHTLARLCMLAQSDMMLANLREAPSADEMYQVLLDAEDELLKAM